MLNTIKKIVALEIPNSNIKCVTQFEEFTYLNTVEEVNRSVLNDSINFNVNDVWKYKGKECIVGLPTSGGSGGVSSNRYRSEEFKRECAFALARIVKSRDEELTIVTGVPAIEYDNKQLHKDIENNLLGDYEVYQGNIKRTFKVVKVVVLPQPLGTILSHFFTKDLKQQVSDEEIMSDWLVLDIGWGTTDITTINAAKGVDKCDTIYEGMGKITSEMAAMINQKYPRANIKRIIKSPYQLSQLVEGKDEIVIGTKYYDIKNIKKTLYDSFAQRIYQNLLNNGYDLEFTKILLTGGGGIALYDSIVETFKDCYIELSDNAQLANAIGFYIYGKRKLQ